VTLLRRIPVAARWCALAAILNALVWSIVTPPFHVPDETVHVTYAQSLAENGDVPNEPGKGVFSDEQAQLMVALRFGSVVGRPRDRTIPTDLQSRPVEALVADPADRSHPGGTTESSSQPPLYYGLEALVYQVSPWRDLLHRLWLMRALSALLAGATVLFVFMFLRELFAEPWTWTVGALVVAFQPVFGFIGGGVSPDNLLFAASAALFFALARSFNRGLTMHRGLGIGAALAVGALAKLNFLALVPGALLGVSLLLWRDRQRDQEAWKGAGAAVGVPALVGFLYVALNLAVWDRSAWGGGVETATRAAAGGDAVARAIGVTEQLSYTWQLYLPRLPFMNDQFTYYPVWQSWFKGGIGRFGWLDTVFDEWVYTLAAVIAVPIVVLALIALIQRRAALQARWPELLTYAAIAGGLLVSIGLLGLRYRIDTGAVFEQFRYLLPFAALYGAAVALAALGAGRRFSRPVGAALVVLALAHGLFAQLLVIGRFYG
jgi:4-amino-4-deoxy-L-arabinose transferase-like glycosyltransferase